MSETMEKGLQKEFLITMEQRKRNKIFRNNFNKKI